MNKKVEVINYPNNEVVGLKGVVTGEDDIQYFVRLDHNKVCSGTLSIKKTDVKFVI